METLFGGISLADITTSILGAEQSGAAYPYRWADDTPFVPYVIYHAAETGWIFDPFTQREYYQLYDFFNRIDEKGLDSDPAPPFVKVPTEVQARELESAVAQAKELTTRHQEARCRRVRETSGMGSTVR